MLLSLNTNISQRQGETLLEEPEHTVRNVKGGKQKCHFPPRKTYPERVGTRTARLKPRLQQKAAFERKTTGTRCAYTDIHWTTREKSASLLAQGFYTKKRTQRRQGNEHLLHNPPLGQKAQTCRYLRGKKSISARCHGGPGACKLVTSHQNSHWLHLAGAPPMPARGGGSAKESWAEDA